MAAIVVGVIAWPIVHIGLVSHYRIDPWELFGWSMYAVPAARVQVGVKVERAGKTEAVFPLGMERERIRDFSRRRTALGSLAPTDDLAREILATDATIDAVVIIMREIRFDPQTAHIVAIESSTRTDRSLVTSP
jgi:hypothetical protein